MVKGDQTAPKRRPVGTTAGSLKRSNIVAEKVKTRAASYSKTAREKKTVKTPSPSPAKIVRGKKPVRTELDNSASWLVKIGVYMNVPNRWLIPKAVLRRQFIVGDAISDGEEVENSAMDSDADAWVPITDILKENISIDDFYMFITSPSVRSTSAFTPTDAIMFYYARPRPGDAGYRGPASMTLADNVDMDEVNSVWTLDQNSIPLIRAALESRFDAWRVNSTRDYDLDAAELARVQKRQIELKTQKPLDNTSFTEEDATVHVPFEFERGRGLRDYIDGLDILSNAEANKDVPFIKWIPATPDLLNVPYLTGGANRGRMVPAELITAKAPFGSNPELLPNKPVKIYSQLASSRSEELNAAIPLRALNENEKEELKVGGSVLLMSVYFGREADTFQGGDYSKKTFYTIAVLRCAPGSSPLRGVLSMRLNRLSIPIVVNRIRNALSPAGSDGPNIVFFENRARRTRISGYFDVTLPSKINFRALTMMTSINPILKAYFYVEEGTNVQADKNRFTLQFRGQGRHGGWDKKTRDAATTVAERRDTAEDEVTGRSSLAATLTTGPGNSLRVNIVRARLPTTVQLFTQVFIRAIPIVLDHQYTINAEIDRILGPIAPTEKEMEGRVKKKEKPMTEAEILAEQAPDVFVTNYARTCQRYKPTIIPDEDVDSWLAKGKQVMRYPPEHAKQPVNGAFNLVCDHEKAPYPGVSPSTNMDNSADYPFVPCCMISNQMEKKKSNYNVWYKGAGRTTTRAPSNIIITGKPLSRGRVGALEPVIASLLSGDLPEPVTFARLGVEEDSENSLIHALLIATRDPFYDAIKTSKERLKYAERKRVEWFDKHPTALLSQETVGMSSISGPLDASIVYRLFEEELDINLFVLEEGPRLQIPRHSRFHVRPARLDRKSVVLWRPPNGQYELITALKDGGKQPLDRDTELFPNAGSLLGSEWTRRLYSAYFSQQRVSVWRPETGSNELGARLDNAESAIDVAAMVADFSPIAQIIDSSGHCRAVEIDKGGYLQFWPAQPLDLPLSSNDPDRYITADSAEKRHGHPIALDIDSGRVIGLWYALARKANSLRIYVPIRPESVDRYPGLPTAEPSPLNQGARETADTPYEIDTLKRSLYITAQWLTYLIINDGAVVAAKTTDDVKSAVDTFFRKYARIVPANGSEAYYYVPPKNRAFPLARGEASLAAANESYPSLVEMSDDSFTIRVPSKEFISRMTSYLIRVIQNVGLPSLRARRYIHGVINDVYLRGGKGLAFTDDTHFLHWYAAEQRAAAAADVNQIAELPWARAPYSEIALHSLTPSIIVNSTVPILFTVGESPEKLAGRTLLIQSVFAGELLRAFSVCVSWQAESRNPGYRAEPARFSGDAVPAYSVIEIQPDGKLAITDRHTDAEGNGLFLLRVQNKKNLWYAAVLVLG